jgi:hypothetical protein
MWAAGDAEKAKLLIEHGADVNAHSDGGRTPLLIAAGFGGPATAVKPCWTTGPTPTRDLRAY